MTRGKLLQYYYLATPAFFLLDVTLSAPIRVAALDELGMRGAYYALVFGAGLLIRWRPGLGPVVGLLESSVNLLLLALSILLPIWGMLDQVGTTQPLSLELGSAKFWNVFLSGPILILAVKESEAGLMSLRR